MRHWLSIVFSAVVLIVAFACQQDEEELYDEPNVRLTFYNMDSLVQVQDTLAQVDTLLSINDDSLMFYSDSASVLLDSIGRLTVLILEGDESLIPVRDEVDSIYQLTLIHYDQFVTADSVLGVSESHWSTVANVIESGVILISSISNKKNGNAISYEDSTDVWQLPLSNSENDVSLSFEIDGQNYDLNVSYQRTTTVDEYNNVVIQAYDIDTISQTFDSLYIKCSTLDCIDYETTFDIYF